MSEDNQKVSSTTQEVPKWFTGQVYTEGEEVRNQFSGETYYLNAVELSIYDMIMGGQFMMEMMGGPFDPRTAQVQDDMAKGLSWFRQHNAEAYMVLLD
jgi:hypothetical protein